MLMGRMTLNARNDVVLGVDIGGTNTVLGLVNRDGQCFGQCTMPTNAHQSATDYFRRLNRKADEMLQSVRAQVRLMGVGIGAPNANYYKGTIERPPNLSWGYVNVVEEVHRFFDLPVVVTNDANAAAIGEMLFGAAQGMKDFIVITLGTGLGSGIVSGGSLVYGADGFAGEIGHTIVDPEGRECGCGRRGCLETYASATGIRRTAMELLAERTDASELRSFSYERLTGKDIYDAAMRGDRVALEAFEVTGRILGMKLADSVAHTSPEAIILFGGLAKAGELIFKPTKRYLEEYLLGIFKNKVQLLPSGLPEGNSAVLGAAGLIWNELNTVDDQKINTLA